MQLYIAPPQTGEVIRPVRELKAFETLRLAPGESKTVELVLEKRAFAHWAEAVHGWRVEGGEYRVQVCENAETVLLEQAVTVTATQPLRPIVYSLGMTMGDFAKTPAGRAALDENIGYMILGMAAAGFLPREALEPLKAMGGGAINLAAVELLAARIGMDAGGTGGVAVLFGQPVSMLTNFMPPEKVEALKDVLQQLNQADDQ